MTDWLGILAEAIETGDDMARQVPAMIAAPAISVEQVKTLFAALEQQAQFCEKLKAALEALDYDFPIVDKAGALEERYADLAASAAEKLRLMRGRNTEGSRGEEAGASDATRPEGQPGGTGELPSAR